MNKKVINLGGRPTKLTDDTVKKLEDIFKVGGTVEEACSYAGITKPTYYAYIKDDEGFLTKMDKARHYADIMAKNVVVKDIVEKKNLETAKWWLEKREFKNTPTVAQQFNIGGKMNVEVVMDDEIKLHKNQYEIYQDQHRFKIVNAGRRFGKSVLSQVVIFKWASEEAGLYWIVAPTYVQGKTIHWQGLLNLIPKEFILKVNENELSITLKNGSVISIKSAENADSLRGSGLRGLIVDEIASIRDWLYLWQQALRPALSDYQGKVLFISTPQGFNHFYDLYQKGLHSKYPDYKSWHFTSYDNPKILKSEIDSAKNELTEDAFATEYLADSGKFWGLVFKEFDRHTMVKELKDFQPRYYIRGLDRGYTAPTAVPVIAVDKDDNWYQLDEIYQPQLTNVALFDVLNNKSKEHSIKEYELSTMDPAQIGDIIELNQMGADFIPVKKESGEANKNYVVFKIQKFAERLKQGKFIVNPNNVNTIFEFEHYEWQQKKIVGQTGMIVDEPLKLNDHMMDALGDLNLMYLHTFDKAKSPYADKIPTTYIEPSVKEEDENAWDVNVVEDYGQTDEI